jgi:Domain of unknown function (DUF4268)
VYLIGFANGYASLSASSVKGELKMTKSERRDYWRRFLERLRTESLLLTEREPYDFTWQVIDEWSRHKIRLSARLNAEENWIHIDLTFSGPSRYEHFDRLLQESGRIPGLLRARLSDRPEKYERDAANHPKECWIYLRRPGDPSDSHTRDAQHEWLVQALRTFREVFGTHLERW